MYNLLKINKLPLENYLVASFLNCFVIFTASNKFILYKIINFYIYISEKYFKVSKIILFLTS